jgi:hypothetical protein
MPIAAASGDESGTAASFYSWAFQPGDAASGIFAELNGETRVVQGDRGSIATIPSLGSDLVTLTSDCGNGWQLLATKPGDWTASDSVQAFQILNNQALPVGREVDFDGPVTALWPAEGGKTVHAVVHGLKSGFYEAYSLSITCGR